MRADEQARLSRGLAPSPQSTEPSCRKPGSSCGTPTRTASTASSPPGLPEWNLRGSFSAGTDGTFEIRSIQPAPHQISTDGSCGKLIAAAGWHIWHIWRVGGEYANYSIFDIDSTDQLHEVLSRLPLFPYLDIKVTPLAKHPPDIHL